MWSGPRSIFLNNLLRHTLLSEPAECRWRPWAMSTPVYYLKISVKIPNKMTVCKPQRRALMRPAEHLRSPSLNHSSHPLSSFSVRHSPGRGGGWGLLQRRAGKWKKEAEQEKAAQDRGGGGGVGGKRKKAVYSAFVLIIPPRLEDIQAAGVPRLGFGRRVISGSAGERLQRSTVSRRLRRWVGRKGEH